MQDKLQRDGEEEFQLHMLRDNDRLLEPGLIWARVFSRFRNATKHQLWISYQPTNNNEIDNENENDEPLRIQSYYCTCQSGARTVGTCAHVASVLWYLGYARHNQNIRYPSTRLIETIQDAGNRPHNINMVP